MAKVKPKTCIKGAGLLLLIFLITLVLKSLKPENSVTGSPFGLGKAENIPARQHSQELTITNKAGASMESVNISPVKGTALGLSTFPSPNYNLHAFYYTWFGSPQFDGKYMHWDHPLLPHWDTKVASNYPNGRHSPPEDIGANFYPALGAYSSRDPTIIEAHMQQLRTAAVGVLALSWYPPGMKDDNGEPTDDFVPLILHMADKYQLKVAFHIEPYQGRDEENMYNNVKYILEKYGNYPAFYRYKSKSGASLPLFYVYDSYLLSPEKWASLLKDTGAHSVRNTPYDGIFLGLLVEEKHKRDILSAGFDGVYTYFATNGFTYGSSHQNWRTIKGFCDSHDLLFVPSVGPGYVDTSIRPWNSKNTRNRINGKYYETSLRAALDSRPDIVSITSFNEWHEGTQIEKAVPKTAGKTTYLDYLPHTPDVYLEITHKWSEIFVRERERWLM